LNHNYFAAPFISCELDGYHTTRGSKILYVGQATAGDWFLEQYLEEKNLETNQGFEKSLQERLLCTKRFFKGGGRNSQFWRFAKKLSGSGSQNGAALIEPLENLVWSNLVKIGVKNGNPKGLYYIKQKDIAVQTLRLEIQYYKPDLIYIAHGRYGGEIVDSVFDYKPGLWNEENWNGFWFRERSKEFPPIIRSDHPGIRLKGIKTTEKHEKWLKKVHELLHSL
jgi:hypothetical protein